jgi:hypothetical protein
MGTTQPAIPQEQAEKEDPIVAFRCPPDLKKAARLRAVQDDTSIQDLCIRALRTLLESPDAT